MSGGTVLVVDDCVDVLETMEQLLGARGYQVLVARDGLKALTLLACQRVDVIVLDLSMPGMNGWEFLDARAADPTLATIPVVVLSALAGVAEGAWDVIVAKPFVAAELLGAIERVTPARTSPSAPGTPGSRAAAPPRG